VTPPGLVVVKPVMTGCGEAATICLTGLNELL
jgi:hypothetical protein